MRQKFLYENTGDKHKKFRNVRLKYSHKIKTKTKRSTTIIQQFPLQFSNFITANPTDF